MEINLLSVLKEGGLSALAIMALLYSTSQFNKILCQERKQFMEYIEKHNHQTTEIVAEYTRAVVESSNNIKENTEVLKKVADGLETMRRWQFQNK